MVRFLRWYHPAIRFVAPGEISKPDNAYREMALYEAQRYWTLFDQ